MWNRLIGFIGGILSVVGVVLIYMLGIGTGRAIYKEEAKPTISYRRKYGLDKEEEES